MESNAIFVQGGDTESDLEVHGKGEAEEELRKESWFCEDPHMRLQCFLWHSFPTVSRSLKNGTVLPLPEPTRFELWVRVRIRSDAIRG
jgi:hypothetical protein